MAKRAGGVSSPVESMAMDDRPCEKDALCTRGYRHLGRGGPCSRKPRLKRAPRPGLDLQERGWGVEGGQGWWQKLASLMDSITGPVHNGV